MIRRKKRRILRYGEKVIKGYLRSHLIRKDRKSPFHIGHLVTSAYSEQEFNIWALDSYSKI